MVVPNLLFDLLVYGALLAGLLADMAVPSLRGAATLVAICAATYFAAEDSSILLSRRRVWTQESLATALSLSVVVFMYYWWRNDSDLVAVVLHVGLMMASLMILIALVSVLTATIERKSPAALAGLLATALISLLLGAVAGAMGLFLTSLTVALPVKIGLVAAGAVIWKLREAVRPPAHHPAAVHGEAASAERTGPAHPAMKGAAGTRPEGAHSEGARPGGGSPKVAHPGSRRVLVPQRGSMLDRFAPLLLLCLAAFLALGNGAGGALKP